MHYNISREIGYGINTPPDCAISQLKYLLFLFIFPHLRGSKSSIPLKRINLLIYIQLFCGILLLGCEADAIYERSEKRVLLFSSKEGWSDPLTYNIAATISALENDTKADTIQSFDKINEDSLLNYSALIFVNIKPEEFSSRQQSLIERYVQAGGGLMALNAGLSNRYYWPWYFQGIDNAKQHKDHGYSYDGGRLIVVDQADSLADLKKELTEWISYAIGENTYDTSRIKSPLAPEEVRFVKKVLDNQIYEPMELAVLPDLRVLFIERRGAVKLYDPELGKTKTIEEFNVNIEGNYEDGMLGLAIDPNFKENNWIYIYYSPAGDEPKQNLSRFILQGDSLLMDSEVVMLEVPVQRETCCHSAGSIVFGPDGLLYLSTGDNTSSKESDGYTPIDERPGRGPFDAQKSSGNTNDLRGKILRIKPNADGTYDIPEGNLFARDHSGGKPEIYLMGLRNPFRFTVNPKTSYVYWGDVGPDSGKDSELGPRSYDEFNQAREPGFYGWPYFVADNIPYPDLNFATGKIGPLFDPENPVNNSPNNTGDTLLPRAFKPLIWYPYAESKEFPMVGTGSRSAMGGPFFYHEQYDAPSKVKFPDYYDGKWFIYDWARSWIKVVSFDENHNMIKIEDFLPEMPLSKPIDMEFGPNGAMYILEYGKNYFENNEDATLSVIEYNGYNMQPVPLIAANKTKGGTPLEVHFSARDSYDYDREDELKFNWFFTRYNTPQATGAEVNFTFEQPGVYPVKLEVTDSKGAIATSFINIQAGNESPEIEISLAGNSSFYFDDAPIPYAISISDKEDGSEIVPENVRVRFDYLPHGYDLALLGPEESILSAGQILMEKSDCKTCHAYNKNSIGPSYMAIADRYEDSKTIQNTLALKIINGGNGVWGVNMMAAHPQHTVEEAQEMVKYILTLDENPAESLPLSGDLIPDRHAKNESGRYYLSASYTDKGSDAIEPITERKSIMLRPPKLDAEEYDKGQSMLKGVDQDTNVFLKAIQDEAFIAFNEIDLTGIEKIILRTQTKFPVSISLRLDGFEGQEIGKIDLKSSGENDWEINEMNISAVNQKHDLYFIFEGNPGEQEDLIKVDWLLFKTKNKSQAL